VRHLLRVRDVADLAGVGYNTVIEWVKAGLPTIHPAGRRSHLIDPNDLEAFLQEHKSSGEAKVGTRIGTKSRFQTGETRGNAGEPWYAKYQRR